MTVTSLWYSGELRDASLNYQTYQQNKGSSKPDYDINDKTCAELIKTITLGTKAFFDFAPTEDQIKRKIGKMLNKNAKKVTKDEYNDNKVEAEDQLRKEEEQKPFQVRHTEGDASESGLIKFCQPIKDLTEVRKTYPIHSYKEKDDHGEVTNIECEIPFNSMKKYNLIIRDISHDKSSNNFMLILKGAPERIWGRCSNILVNGGIQKIDDLWHKRFEEANATFGKRGERVLAFANIYLNNKEYPKDSKFIMKEELKNYPMENLTFIGLVALNDPPRKYVDNAVNICRRAGIKVIMVTGDQPVTAAAIAKKVNIISKESTTNVDLMEQGMSEQEALEKCDAVVVHGDELALKSLTDEQYDDDDPEKGRFMQYWIAKEEIVFARTTPSQKLLIVDACQKAGHVVAVTGDGVNDSPAIKKANIGIAMGSGSDVAKNAADMIILDDDFSSIVKGIEEGRLIFENLKKSIAYTLTHIAPEIIPFILFIIAQIPLPITTVLILLIDLGTEMVPAISFAYEGAESDIMLKNPRSNKRDHLANTKLISFSYLQLGLIETAGCMYTYFIVMNDYGFKPATVFGIMAIEGHHPNSGDRYDPTQPQKGNTNTSGHKEELIWNTNKDNDIDVRLFFWEKDVDSWSDCRWGDSAPKWWRHNPIQDVDICYSTDAIKYAQSAYFIALVVVQWANLMVSRTRSASIAQHGMSNRVANIGLIFSTILASLIIYIPPLNIALNTRMIASAHYGVPAFPFFAVIFFYDELRKSFIRSGINKETGKLEGWFAQNTY